MNRIGTFFLYVVVEGLGLFFFWMGTRNPDSTKTKKWNRYVVLALIVLASIMVLRGVTVGADYVTYLRAIVRVIHNRMTRADKSWLPIGFIGLIKFLMFIHVPVRFIPFIVVWLIEIVTLWLYLDLFMHYSSNPTMSLYLLICSCLYLQLMNQFRQGLAIALGLYAYKYINKSMIKYFIIILLASTIHITAIVLLPFYFSSKLKFTWKTVAIAAVAVIFLMLNYNEIVRLLSKYTFVGSSLFGNKIFDISFKTSTLLNTVLRGAMFILCFLVRDIVAGNSAKKNNVFYMLAACFIIQLLAIKSTVFSRLTLYFYVYYFLILPDVFEAYNSMVQIKIKKVNLNYIMLVAVLFVYFFVYYRFNGGITAHYDRYTTLFIDHRF